MAGKTGKIFIITGPSGVGKDTVVGGLKNIRGYKSLDLKEPKSYTTRRRRKTDVEGQTPYIFVSQKKFSELMLTDMIEHTENHGHLYGMSKASFEECIESGGNVIKIMNRDGALAFKKIYPNEAVTIYLRPPSVEVLAERLRGRGTESFAEYNRRMMNNINEMKTMAEYDYVVTSSTPETTTKIVFAIIQAIAQSD